MALPPAKRWATLAGLFLLSQIVVFGALPALFFKNISNNLFNSMLGAAAGVMLAATAFSLLVPGMTYGNAIWPGKGIYIVSLGMLIGAVFLHYADRQLPHVRFDSVSDTQLNSLKKSGFLS
jgi:ZIP family zinc transporter